MNRKLLIDAICSLSKALHDNHACFPDQWKRSYDDYDKLSGFELIDIFDMICGYIEHPPSVKSE